MIDVTQREIFVPLGVIVEKRKSSHPWGDWNCLPVAVYSGANPNARWVEMRKGDDFTQYHCKTIDMALHRKETEAFIINFESPKPHLYVVMAANENEDPAFPFDVHAVTASPYTAQDYLDSAEYIVEKVLIPDEVADIIARFVDEHHKEEVFLKRKRDKLNVEKPIFGKEPIFNPKPSGRTTEDDA